MPKKSARKKGATDICSNLLTPIQLPVVKTKGTLSPSAQPKPKRKIKKPTGFLDLAPETRNQIYGYYFQQDFLCEFAGKEALLGYKYTDDGTEKLTERMKFQSKGIKRAPLTAVRFSRVLGDYQRINGLDTHWSTSLTALIFVSKTLYTETIPFLYRCTTFSFDSPTRILNFLATPSPSLLTNVTKLHLQYIPYGDPQEFKHEIYMRKHIASWDRACAALAKRLVNLQHLNIWVYITESKVYLSTQAAYLRPLAQFRKTFATATSAKVNRSISVRVDSRWTKRNAFAIDALQEHSMELHRLHGEGIALEIRGEATWEATRGFREYWNGPCWAWQEHLQFGDVV